MEIRALSPQDAEAFRALRLRGLLECPAAFASSYAEEQGVTVAAVAERLSPRNGGAVIGAFLRNALVGVVGVKREERAKLAHKAFIWGMYVSPEARNLGIGTALVERALQYAAVELRVKQVNLGVSTENTAALALYRRAGFMEYGCERGSMIVDGVPHDEYRMVCHVASATSEAVSCWRYMTGVRLRSVSRGVATALLALVPAYCSIEGLVTGATLGIAKRSPWHTGIAGVVTAIAYGLFATALFIAAVRYFTSDSKRRAALFKWAWSVTIAAAVLFFLGRFVWVVQ